MRCRGLVVLLALVAAACGPARTGPQATATRVPGHVAAGGGTSGTVMAAASAAARDMGPAAREAGTPGIPQGAGGNTAGAQMGGTVKDSALGNSGEQTAGQRTPGNGAPAHAGAQASAPPAAASAASASAPMSPASAAELQKRLLDERMTLVAERWKQRATATGRPVTAASQAASGPR